MFSAGVSPTRTYREYFFGGVIPAGSEKTSAIVQIIVSQVLNGNLLHFAAYKAHYGFYPSSTGIEHFKDELSLYQSSKGAVQFPFDKPIPFELISKIVHFRVQENLERVVTK